MGGEWSIWIWGIKGISWLLKKENRSSSTSIAVLLLKKKDSSGVFFSPCSGGWIMADCWNWKREFPLPWWPQKRWPSWNDLIGFEGSGSLTDLLYPLQQQLWNVTCQITLSVCETFFPHKAGFLSMTLLTISWNIADVRIWLYRLCQVWQGILSCCFSISTLPCTVSSSNKRNRSRVLISFPNRNLKRDVYSGKVYSIFGC